jgi:hypothetical protein
MGQADRARSLLSEVDATVGARESPSYPAHLASMARVAVEVGDPELADRLMRDLEPRSPYAEHARVAAHAVLAEARGDFGEAALAYGDAAERWAKFGHVPERAFALLGRGRCLNSLMQHSEAIEPLRAARAVFAELRIRPALEEADSLVARAMQLSS